MSNLTLLLHFYTEAKVDVTQEIEQRAQQAAQAGADHCTLCSIYIHFSLSVYRASHVLEDLGWVDLDLRCSTILLGQ